jgi:hypothetical protein
VRERENGKEKARGRKINEKNNKNKMIENGGKQGG